MKKVVLSPSLNKRLISRLMSSRPTTETAKNFNLKGSNEFLSRSKDVFGELKSLEVAHESWISKNNTHECFPESRDTETSEFVKPLNSVKVSEKRKDDSVVSFKKPMVPRNKYRKNHAPLKGRKKWIKYSLEDVPLSSNADNTSTALAFITELRKRKEPVHDTSDINEKLLFSKPREKVLRSKLSSSNNLSSVSSAANKNAKSTIKLDHLEHEDV
ncbi:uncharacterized protein [Parasteatoda tepidariorum]|uniref:uncharacterized protein n=1 Tax=Parasteatoda tepidariorum TaxID=114398 RepID=UPI00077FB2BD